MRPNRARNIYLRTFWTEHLPFLLDGTGFARKTNPCEQARVIKMEEDIRGTCRLGCTSKGQEQGTGGRVLKHMVAISYGKGMVICKPYNKNAWSVRFKFIQTETYTPVTADRRIHLGHDRDPSQNDATLVASIGLLKLPPRRRKASPTPILPQPASRLSCASAREKEKSSSDASWRKSRNSPLRFPTLYLVSNKLEEQTLSQNITKESFQQFQRRAVKTVNTMYSERRKPLTLMQSDQ